MAKDTICTGAKLTAIADAIRAKGGTQEAMTLDEMAEAVESLAVGGGMDDLADGSLSGDVTLGVESLRAFALYGCRNVTSLTLPDATSISEGALTGCSSLTRLVAPKLAYIYGNPFSNVGADGGWPQDTALAEMDLPGMTSAQTKVYVGPLLERMRIPSITDLGYNRFSGSFLWFPSTGHKKASFGLSMPAVRTMAGGPSSSRALFSSVPADKQFAVHLPSLESTSGYVFYQCLGLRSIYLPSLASLGTNAFYGCSNLTAVVLPGQTVCAKTGSPFYGSPIHNGSGGYVYVPAALLDAYAASTSWSGMSSVLRAIEEWPDEVAAARALYDAAGAGWD